MLGVKLYTAFTKTRQNNGEILLKIMQEIINRWKRGKFMPFIVRPLSINTYALSKIWYKAGSIDFNGGDLDKITSLCKSWLYADCFLKSEEIILYRPILEGGLGLINISAKSCASLTTSFLQTAKNPKFITNPYHYALYNYFVHDIGVKNPRRPPYYSLNFFKEIKNAENEGCDTTHMTIKDWYERFLKKTTHIYCTEAMSWIKKN